MTKALLIIAVICGIIYGIYERLTRTGVIKEEIPIIKNLILIFAIISVIGVGVNTTISLIKTRYHDIDVYPKKISIPRSGWDKISQFVVRNNLEIPLFSVWIKLSSADTEVDLSKINIEPQDEKWQVVTSFGDASISCDAVQIIGKDSKGKNAIFIILYKLLPKENKTFDVKIYDTEKMIKKASYMRLSIVKFQYEPTDILQKRDQEVALKIEPPENLKVAAISILMKKLK